MNYTNCNFPLIKYDTNQNNKEWGFSHGESFRKAIKELCEIRKHLMLAKNPSLLKNLDDLALQQFKISQVYCPYIADEIKGIADGSNCSLTDIVILNNYTDFRDIILPEEGCSTIHVQNNDHVLAGQTWDMHRSAKNYMCLIQIPSNSNSINQLVLSLVGCVGLMGINSKNCMIGVNNINTQNAKIGLIWPLLVRKLLQCGSLHSMRNELLKAPVTSGHNYLLSSNDGGEHFEVTPTMSEKVSALNKGQTGSIFHTNHCLSFDIQNHEDRNSLSSTTFSRYDLLSKKSSALKTMAELHDLLCDHDQYPKSICSHFENGSQDPSFTCGGGVCDLTNNNYVFWRGCRNYDEDFKEYRFELKDYEFKLV